MNDSLIIRGAREHNLKGVDLDLPRDTMIALHRPVRLGQVLPRLRHDLAEGQRRYVESLSLLRPSVPGPDGQTRRRAHRGPEPGCVHRPEVHLAQPPIHGGYGDGGLRLPAPALLSRGRPALPRLRRGHLLPDPAADRRPGPLPARGHPLPGTRPRGAGPQGRVLRALHRAARTRFQPGARRRRLRAPRHPTDAQQASQARHRGHRRPPRRT